MVSARVGFMMFVLVCGAWGAHAAETVVANAKVAYPSLADADAFKGAFAKFDSFQMGLGAEMFSDVSANGVAKVTSEFKSSQGQVSPYVSITGGRFSCGFFHENTGFGIMALDAETVFLGFDSWARDAKPAPIAIPNLRCFKRR